MNVTRILRGITALVFVAALIAAFVPVLNDVFNRHVLSVRVTGKLDHLARIELEAAVREQLRSASFFTVEVESLRRAAASLPWVRDVAVRRVWPDSVHIAVEERVAVVRWNDDALMEDDASILSRVKASMASSWRSLPVRTVSMHRCWISSSSCLRGLARSVVALAVFRSANAVNGKFALPTG